MFTDDAGRLRPIWAFVLSALLACVAFFVAGYTAAALAGDHILRFEVIFRPLLVVLLMAAFSWLLAVGDHVEVHRLAAQGLPLSPGWVQQLALGCALGLLLVTIAVVPVVVWGNVSFRLTLNLHSVARTAVVLGVLGTGALAEELMFRGYPFQRLLEAVGAAGAILVFSVLFGVVHLSNPGASVWGMINTVAIGALLAFAYLRTQALWLPWGIHFAWNTTLGLLLGLPVSGLRLFNVDVHATALGPRWLTGGPYGVEASASGALAVALGFLIVWKAPLNRLGKAAALPQSTNHVTAKLTDIPN